MKRLLFLLPILVLAGLAAVFAVGLQRDPSVLPSQLIGRPLPAFSLPGLNGQPGLTSTELRGEPKLLNVWASWCPPCRAEHPVLMKLASEGVPIYGLDWKDKPEDGAAFLADLGNPFRRVGNDASGRTGIDLGVSAAPETFLIDAQGRVRYRHVGPITPEIWQDTLKPIYDKLKAEA